MEESGDHKQENKGRQLRQGIILSKSREEAMRKKMIEEVKITCKEYYLHLAVCAQNEGLIAVINCRKQSRALNNCFDEYYNDVTFTAYLAKHGFPPPQKSKSLWESVHERYF